ncbi:VOC family protein [Saccharomonospora sp.]|uniref:VOC family protein n=1 Tax=Saccharomonospora sp. TaxID=33913 RepID=UPI00261A3AA2|nr:VOC family protein [Saccharomonospora sp.]
MIVRDTPYPDGTPCWVDLLVPDPRRAMDFYGALFGWAFADQGDETDNYLLCLVNGRIVAGLGGRKPRQEAPPVWTTYLATSDVDATAARVTDAGGRLLTGPTDMLWGSRMALASDPTGAVFGLWQAGRVIGAQLTDAPSALMWNECLTRDFSTAKEFYGRVFGYTVSRQEDQDLAYGTFVSDERVVGGLGELSTEVPADVPPHWMTYFGVVDTDAVAARATELDGNVVVPPADSPYGRVAVLADNQGVGFSVITVTAEPEAT